MKHYVLLMRPANVKIKINFAAKYFQICITSNSYKQVSILSFKRDAHIQSVVTYLNLFDLAAFSRSKKWNSL